MSASLAELIKSSAQKSIQNVLSQKELDGQVSHPQADGPIVEADGQMPPLPEYSSLVPGLPLSCGQTYPMGMNVIPSIHVGN